MAANNSPVTIVRVLGDQATGATGAGVAGWQTSGSYNSLVAENGGAYGLFLIDSGSLAANATGSLAAIFYVDSGALMLEGVQAGGPDTISGAGKMVVSNAANAGFKMNVLDSSGTVVESVQFNLSRNSEDYVRSAFNTNPTLTHTTLSGLTTPKSYWLGESFERHAGKFINETAAAGKTYGILLALAGATTTTCPSYHREGVKKARTGWFIGQDFGVNTSYVGTSAKQLFYLEALQDGEDLQKNTIVVIDDLSLPANPNVNSFGTFSLKIVDINGSVLEEYRGLNFNPSSRDYIGRRIGDQSLTWDETDLRYRVSGDYPNNSDYVRCVVHDSIADNGPDKTYLPFGFFGPTRPKTFELLSGSANPSPAGAFVKGRTAYTGSTYNSADAEFVSVGAGITDMTASFNFPAIPLRQNGTEGNPANPYSCTWGIRPTLSSTSATTDPDYVDYVRRQGSLYHAEEPSAEFEYSFVFSLDDLVVDASANTVTYTSGSRRSGTSYTATNSVTDLLNKKFENLLLIFGAGLMDSISKKKNL